MGTQDARITTRGCQDGLMGVALLRPALRDVELINLFKFMRPVGVHVIHLAILQKMHLNILIGRFESTSGNARVKVFWGKMGFCYLQSTVLFSFYNMRWAENLLSLSCI